MKGDKFSLMVFTRGGHKVIMRNLDLPTVEGFDRFMEADDRPIHDIETKDSFGKEKVVTVYRPSVAFYEIQKEVSQ